MSRKNLTFFIDGSNLAEMVDGHRPVTAWNCDGGNQLGFCWIIPSDRITIVNPSTDSQDGRVQLFPISENPDGILTMFLDPDQIDSLMSNYEAVAVWPTNSPNNSRHCCRVPLSRIIIVGRFATINGSGGITIRLRRE